MPDLNLNLSRSKNFFFLPKPFCPLLCENQMQIQVTVCSCKIVNKLRRISHVAVVHERNYEIIAPESTLYRRAPVVIICMLQLYKMIIRKIKKGGFCISGLLFYSTSCKNQISFLSNQLRIFSLLTYQFIVPTKTPNTPEEKNGCRQCYQIGKEKRSRS